MTQITQPVANDVSLDALNALIISGDMSKLNPNQKLAYYHQVCEKSGLNPFTRPFDYMVLNGKQVLYANKGCAEQIRNIKGISISDIKQEMVEDLIVITVQGKDSSGRVDTEMGFAPIYEPDTIIYFSDGKKQSKANPKAGKKLSGDNLGNAILKAMTKAKRRLTLSMAGLGMLDETEVESIAGAQKIKDVMPMVDADGVVIENDAPVVPTISDEQAATIDEWLVSTNSDKAKFLLAYNVAGVSGLNQKQYDHALELLKKKAAQNV